MDDLTKKPQWQALLKHYHTLQQHSMQNWFETDPNRRNYFTVRCGGIKLDYSKNRLNQTTRHLLIELAKAQGLRHHIQQLFWGEPVNTTENMPALHTALRQSYQHPSARKNHLPKSQDILTSVQKNLEAMSHIVKQVQGGFWVGYSNKPMTDIVNIGVGGSGLGPRMTIEALADYKPPSIPLRQHFIANMDPANALQTLKSLNPETTLFIVISKSLNTPETLANTALAKSWLKPCQTQVGLSDLSRHFIAVTSTPEQIPRLELGPIQHLNIPRWVGGRYSIWSAGGLTTAIAIGMKHFHDFLNGASLMDEHFYYTDFHSNMPVLLGLIGLWYINFFKANTLAILPYSQLLKHFPDYLQQLEMESNGKSVQYSGEAVTYPTSPIVWGRLGSNCQHAFHQLLLQGSHLTPIDFIFARTPNLPQNLSPTLYQALSQQHNRLTQQAVQQSNILMSGVKDRMPPLTNHKIIPGNCPSNLIILDQLTPQTLGSLIALYEHKVFVQASVWQINPFDQWGVEAAKKAARLLSSEAV